jgi:hypothetical protein
MAIIGTVTVTSIIAPTSSADTYPVTDPLYGIDGLRSVANETERNNIPNLRRREGMLVFQRDTDIYYSLLASPWNGTNTDWAIFSGSGSGTTFTGGTVAGPSIFTNGLTANTFSATTYLGLPLDIRVTGGTYSSGTAVFRNNTGGTFSVSGFSTGSTSSSTFSGGTVTGPTNFTNGLTANTISATTYQNLPYWTSGSTGTFSLKALNDSSIDATGDYALAEGSDTTASGNYSHAEGFNTTASGAFGSHAEGFGTTAVGSSSHAEGDLTTAVGSSSHAEGAGTVASGNTSHAEGTLTTARGDYSHAEGYQTKALGDFSHAEGDRTTASGELSHAEGKATTASGTNSHAEGWETIASGLYSHSEGRGTTASGRASHAGGSGSTASGENSFVHGARSSSIGASTVVLGDNITGTTNNMVFVNRLNIKSLSGGVSVNNLGLDSSGNVVSGGTDVYTTGLTLNNANYNLTLVRNDGVSLTTSLGILATDMTITGGTYNPTTGIGTFTNNSGGTFDVTGFLTGQTDIYVTGLTYNNNQITVKQTNQDYSVFINTMTGLTVNGVLSATTYLNTPYWVSGSTGNFSIKAKNDSSIDATGNYSHAEGLNTTASGIASHAENRGSVALGDYSHAEGDRTTASGEFSHAEGKSAIAVGETSHAEGQSTTASGIASHAEGIFTTAIGNASHVEGSGTTASGNRSHAGGFNSIASGLNSFVHGSGSTASGVNSIVLGSGINGTANNTVFVPYLNIKHLSGGTSVNNLGIDANGYVVSGSTLSIFVTGPISGDGTTVDPYDVRVGTTQVAYGNNTNGSLVSDRHFFRSEASGSYYTHITATDGTYEDKIELFGSGSGIQMYSNDTLSNSYLTIDASSISNIVSDSVSNGYFNAGVGSASFGAVSLTGGTRLGMEADIINNTLALQLNDGSNYRVFLPINTPSIGNVLSISGNPSTGIFTSKWAPVSGGTSATTYTANNGLTLTGTNFQLGSTTISGSPLLHDTYLNISDYNFKISGATSSSFDLVITDSGATESLIEVDNSFFILKTKNIASNYAAGLDLTSAFGGAGAFRYTDFTTSLYTGFYFFPDRAGWNVNNGSTQYSYAFPTGAFVPNSVLTDMTGAGNDRYTTWTPISAITYWTSGSSGTNSVKAINNTSVNATGNYALAEGGSTLASGIASHAEGSGTTASGIASHAEGFQTVASVVYSHSEGFRSTASGSQSHAEGEQTTASGRSSHAEGQTTIAGGDFSHAEGSNTTASGAYSHTEGLSTTASGSFSHAEGRLTIASGAFGSHAEGTNTLASGRGTHAEGSGTTAVGWYSHAEGAGTTANAFASHAEGEQTTADGIASHAEGEQTTANGNYSHAEGFLTLASNGSHAEGQNTTASGIASHAEGFQTVASGGYSHTEGTGNTASGEVSHAEGASTTASGDRSHAGGSSTVASGLNSFVHGSGSTASGVNTVVLGGGITGTTLNTVYVPDFVIKKSAAVPTSSADAVGENGSITWDNTHFYWKANGQWLRVLGATF